MVMRMRRMMRVMARTTNLPTPFRASQMAQTRRRAGHQLFNDNPRGKPRLRTLGYGTRKKALDSVKQLRRMPLPYQRQAATTMFYRAKYHAKQTPDMRQAMKVYRSFLKTLKRA
jgi:hypothetical protein